MSFAEASAIEQDSNESEREGLKDLEKADFEHFQSQVVIPLNELLTGRIAKANALFDGLASRLFDDVESAADMPQEEGDDKPELLEKLTLLKWIFEASEVLHRANYDLLSDRNDRYRDVVWWTNLAGAPGSSFSTVAHDLHHLRRSALNPFFSARAVTALEPVLRAKVDKLAARF
ncbi:hypothetical protein BN1708_017156, partial [Verticillium longisporum]